VSEVSYLECDQCKERIGIAQSIYVRLPEFLNNQHAYHFCNEKHAAEWLQVRSEFKERLKVS
jgi:hypothetical protein